MSAGRSCKREGWGCVPELNECPGTEVIGRGGGGAVDDSGLVHAGAHVAIFGVVKLARLSDRGEGLRLEDVVADLAGGQRLGLDVLALGIVLGLPLAQRLTDDRVPAQVVEEGLVEVTGFDFFRAGCGGVVCALARAVVSGARDETDYVNMKGSCSRIDSPAWARWRRGSR